MKNKEVRFCECCKKKEVDFASQKYCVTCSLFITGLRQKISYYKHQKEKFRKQLSKVKNELQILKIKNGGEQ